MRNILIVIIFILGAQLKAQLNPVLPPNPNDRTNNTSHPQLQLNGGISVSGFSYSRFGDSGINRRPPLGYAVNGHLNIRKGSLSIPLSINLNEQGSRFSAPFSRFGISPTYKWLTAHLGHRNLSYSPFTLNGATFFGAGIDLKPGILKISAMYGNFQQARGLDDPNSFKPQYRRRGYAAQIGLGNHRNFFHLTYFKGEDDPASLNLPDSIANDVDAHENAVFGLDGRIDFIKDKLSLELHSGLSIFSKDVRAFPLSMENQERAEPFAFILRPNISTSANYAGTVALNYRNKGFGMGLSYRRVMPDYQSLGVNYLLDDLEQFTIVPRLSLANGKININGNLGLQRNNLLAQRDAQSQRIIGSASVDYQSESGFGIGLQYGNYSLRQNVIRDTILNDSFLLNQVNQQLSITPRFLLRGDNFTHNFTLFLSYQRLEDDNPATQALSNHRILLANLNYGVRIRPMGLRLNTGISLFGLQSAAAANNRYGSHVQLTKELGKLEIKMGATYNRIMRQELIGNNYRLGGGLEYRLSSKATIVLDSDYYGNKIGARNFQEWINRVRFNYRFKSNTSARRAN